MRRSAGDLVRVFNGRDGEFSGRIEALLGPIDNFIGNGSPDRALQDVL